jgi:hypothetical protein
MEHIQLPKVMLNAYCFSLSNLHQKAKSTSDVHAMLCLHVKLLPHEYPAQELIGKDQYHEEILSQKQRHSTNNLLWIYSLF